DEEANHAPTSFQQALLAFDGTRDPRAHLERLLPNDVRRGCRLHISPLRGGGQVLFSPPERTCPQGLGREPEHRRRPGDEPQSAPREWQGGRGDLSRGLLRHVAAVLRSRGAPRPGGAPGPPAPLTTDPHAVWVQRGDKMTEQLFTREKDQWLELGQVKPETDSGKK